MVISSRSFNDLHSLVSRFVIAHTLALFGLFGGAVPEVSWQPPALVFRPVARSQPFSTDQVKRYAQAVLAIEAERKKTFQSLQTLLGRIPPDLTCTNREALRKLPRKAQAIAVNFCNRSKQIAQESGLSAAEFNQITEAARKDKNLKTQIQKAIVDLRR